MCLLIVYWYFNNDRLKLGLADTKINPNDGKMHNLKVWNLAFKVAAKENVALDSL